MIRPRRYSRKCSGQREAPVQRLGDGRVSLTCLKESKKVKGLEQSGKG